jgi:hypothetical protein
MGLFLQDAATPESLVREAVSVGLTRLESRPRSEWPDQVRFPVMLVFARGDRKAEGKSVAEQLIGSVNYYNAESGHAFDFTYAGWETRNAETPELAFDLAKFMTFKTFVEDLSTWTYSGETDLLIMNFCLEPREAVGHFETDEVIVLPIERMLRKKLIESIDGYMQQIFNFAHLIAAESAPSRASPTWRLSDRLGLQRVRDSVWDAIKQWAAGPFKSDVDALEYMAVRKLTRPGGTPEFPVTLNQRTT